MHRVTSWGCFLLAVLAIGSSGCASRTAGQVELLRINNDTGALDWYSRAPAPPAERPTLFAGQNDPIRSDHDVITLQVETAYIQNLPFRLTGSKDVIIFADVWENGAMAYNAPSLTSIVYIGTNQKVPGKLNLRDGIAYGPTTFKGRPLKIRFTMMVLQKATADRQATSIGVLNSFIEAGAPQYSPITSQAAKLLQNILKAQPDISFFDFEVTFTSDRPETRLPIILPPATPQSDEGKSAALLRQVPSTSFDSSGKGGTDGIHWLRYGRYALVETESYDGQNFPVAGLQTSQVKVEDGWLFGPSGRLATSYVIFRLTCCQLAEDNDVLRAAADANAKLLASLQRSPAEMAAAVKEIQASADDLQDVVIRSKAESIAAQAYREAQIKGTGCASGRKGFDSHWSNETAVITDDKLKKKFADIGTSVKARWAAKCPEPAATPAAAATPALATSDGQDAFKDKLKDKSVTVQSRTFKVVRVVKVSKSDPAEAKPIDIVEVELSVTPATGDKVKRADVQAEIVKAANKAVSDALADSSNPIKAAKITNQEADALKDVWAP